MGLQVKNYEIRYGTANAGILSRTAKERNLEGLGVPLTFVGEEIFAGFRRQTREELEGAVRQQARKQPPATGLTGGHMRKRLLLMLSAAVLVSVSLDAEVWAQSRESTEDPRAEWYFPEWLGTAPYSPVFNVRDTENKYGRYGPKTKTITLKDLIKFHGHFCGGLVESAASLRMAFDRLFADGIVDRTDLRIVSNNSACGADVASYLTGARVRFGSHLIDNNLTESEFYVQQVSTGKTIHVKLNAEMYPKEVKAQMRKIESGQFTPKDIDLFQELQWSYAKRMVSRPLKESFIIREVNDYQWPAPVCKDLGRRRDNDFKLAPRK